jgi:hypothetical protein
VYDKSYISQLLKIVASKNIYKFQIYIGSCWFGMPFAVTIKRKAGIERLTTRKGGVKKGETKN